MLEDFSANVLNLKLNGLNSCLIKNGDGVYGIKSQIKEILMANQKVTGVVVENVWICFFFNLFK